MGAFWIGKSRSLALVGGTRGVRNLHSLPSSLRTDDGVVVRVAGARGHRRSGSSFQDAIILRLVTDHLPAGVRDLSANDLSLVMNDVRNLVAGNVPADVGQRSRCAPPPPNTCTCAASAAWRSPCSSW